jgi:hypothetical protein
VTDSTPRLAADAASLAPHRRKSHACSDEPSCPSLRVLSQQQRRCSRRPLKNVRLFAAVVVAVWTNSVVAAEPHALIWNLSDLEIDFFIGSIKNYMLLHIGMI